MDDEALLRHSAHLFLPEMGVAGVERLARARVLVVGVGGLGSVLALYLARSGVGELTLVDADTVAVSNLPRQVLFEDRDVGQGKAVVAARALQGAAPGEIRPLHERLRGTRLDEEVARADLVCDASDNFATRFALNAACVARAKPLVSAAVIGYTGQLMVIDPEARAAGCYRCLYPEGEEAAESCSERGVLAAAVGVMGTLQATEAVKRLAGIGRPLAHDLLLFDARDLEMHTIHRRRDPACPVCGERSP